MAVRGVGQVEISHLALTNGVTRRYTKNVRRKHRLGRPAPIRGLPAIDGTAGPTLAIHWH